MSTHEEEEESWEDTDVLKRLKALTAEIMKDPTPIGSQSGNIKHHIPSWLRIKKASEYEEDADDESEEGPERRSSMVERPIYNLRVSTNQEVNSKSVQVKVEIVEKSETFTIEVPLFAKVSNAVQKEVLKRTIKKAKAPKELAPVFIVDRVQVNGKLETDAVHLLRNALSARFDKRKL